jgi:DNA-binding response OmpR family regulator
VARVDAVLRRIDTVPDQQPSLRFDGLVVDPGGRRVLLDDEQVVLTQREFELLVFLARHPGRAFTRDQLMEHVWGYSFYTDTSTVTVHIRRLRAKLEETPERPRWIETVWGIGYRFAG